MFIIAVIIADQKTRSADSLILSLFLINQMIYKVTNKIGNKNTNISAVIGITFNKKSWYFMYSFSVVTRLIHRVGSCNGNIIITNGVIKRQLANKTADVILGMLQNGSFKYYRSSPYSDLINDGIKNTFKFGPILIENGTASSKDEPHQRPNQKADRCCIGQVDENNFVILSTKKEAKTDAAQKLGLKLGCTFLYNADGGGSTTLWFRNKKSGKGTQVKSSGRKLPDTLYFVTGTN